MSNIIEPSCSVEPSSDSQRGLSTTPPEDSELNLPQYTHERRASSPENSSTSLTTPTSPARKKKASLPVAALALIKKHWFLVGVACVIALAAAYPDLGKKKGILRTEYTVNYVAVGLIFVLSGISLKTKVLRDALLYWKMHLVIQGLSLGVFPLFAFGVAKLLILANFNEHLAQGIIMACSTPTTIASNVLMTQAGDGNEPAALMNAVLGNILGVFITPSLIGAYLGASAGGAPVNYQDVFTNLAITVICPLILGQIIQFFLPKAVVAMKRYVSFPHLSSALLLLLVYSVFCNTFAEDVGKLVSVTDLLSVVFLNLGFFFSFSFAAFAVSLIPVLRFTRPDTVAIVNCAATKTLALGIPIITVMFNSSPWIGLFSIPLIIYHSEQIVCGFLYVSFFKRWVGAVPGTNDSRDDDIERRFQNPENS